MAFLVVVVTITLELSKVYRNLVSLAGGYSSIPAAIIYLLESGVETVEVTGYMALAFIPVIEALIQYTKSPQNGKLLGVDSSVWSMMVGVGLVSIAVGCLRSVSN